MKVRLQHVLTVLFVLALALGCLSVSAADQQTKQVLLTVEWNDENNVEGFRPESITVGGKTLSAANGWTAVVSAGEAFSVANYMPNSVTVGTDDIQTISLTHKVVRTSHSAQVIWEDGGNAKGMRTDVVLLLMANDEPYGKTAIAGAGNGWEVSWLNLPSNVNGKAAQYSVKALSADPAGYKLTDSTSSSVTYTLQTGALIVNVTVTGAPEGTNLDDLSIKVAGPDSTMKTPVIIKYGDIKATGSAAFNPVIFGAYMAEELNASYLVKKDYVLDETKTHVCAAGYLTGENGEASLQLNIEIAYRPVTEVGPEDKIDPKQYEGNLSFEVWGPSFQENPRTIQFSEFAADGTFTIRNILAGFYVVAEKNAEKLINTYSLLSDSNTAGGALVDGTDTVTISLSNLYQPSPVGETVDVPVIKTWNDNGNKDGNRPASVTVRLLADGTEINFVTLNEDNGWRHTFEDLPRYTDEDPKKEIVYTITEDAVPLYIPVIRGYSIVNEYVPELVSATVSKNWNDNNNANGERPAGIAVSLYDDFGLVRTVVLNDENGWTTTLNNLPAVRNGQRVTYSWTEQQIVGYVLQNAAVDGNNAAFTNTAWERPPVEEAKKPKKAPGNKFFVFEEYETPLGVEVMINHVGDCFD